MSAIYVKSASVPFLLAVPLGNIILICISLTGYNSLKLRKTLESEIISLALMHA